jgi:hypothetical protein
MDLMRSNQLDDPFAGTELSNQSDQVLTEIWNWCVIRGCLPVCLSGRLFMAKGGREKFRSADCPPVPKPSSPRRSNYVVITGGWLVTFRVKDKTCFHSRRKRYALFGAYAYSGMLAVDELHESVLSEGLSAQSRVYQDGLRSSDGMEDTTFVVRLVAKPSTWTKRRPHPWELAESEATQPLPLTKKAPKLLAFRARSKVSSTGIVHGDAAPGHG